MVPLQFVRVSGKELQIPLLPLHVAKGPLLSGRHPHRLHWRGSLQGLRGLRGLRGAGAVAVGAFEGCAGSGAGGATSSVLGGFGLFLLPGGRPLRLGCAVSTGTGSGAGSGVGSSAAVAGASSTTGGSAFSAIYLIPENQFS